MRLTGKQALVTVSSIILAAVASHGPVAASADLQAGDFLVGVAVAGDPARGAIVRVRNGVSTTFCESQGNYHEPGYFSVPTEVVIDPDGHVVFLAPVQFPNYSGEAYALWRCGEMGAPPTLIASFGDTEGFGYPHPLGSRPVRWAGGLHMKRSAGVNLNTGTAAETWYYVMAVADGNGQYVDAIAYDPGTGEWGDFGLSEDPVQHLSVRDIDMINAGDGIDNYTISVGGNQMKVVAEPIQLAFDLFGALTISAAFQHTATLEGTTLDDESVALTIPHNCLSSLPGAPRNQYGDGNSMDGIHGLAWAEDGLVFQARSLAAGHNYLPHLSLELFNLDPTDDDKMMYIEPFFGRCEVLRKLRYTPWHPFNSFNDSTGLPRSVDQLTPDGTAGTQMRDGRIISVGPSQDVTVHATGLNSPTGIDVYPGFKPKLSGLSLFVKIESPVNVVITAPDGRRIGIDPQSGLPVNDFGPGGFDSNTDEPHVYGIRHPMPGQYAIEGVGTGSGPFHITAYGVNLDTMAVTRQTFAGTAEPGQQTAHGLELTAAGEIVTAEGETDTEPPAIIGAVDRSVNATAPLTAVTYDGISATDAFDSAPALTCTPPSGSLFALGTTPVTCTATDAAGNTSTAGFAVTVVAVTPPSISCSVNLSVVWPPNHKLVPVTASVTASSASGAALITLESVTSSEADAGLGSEDLPVDIQGFAFGTDDRAGELRAERFGAGGRTYTLRYAARDIAGNAATCDATVVVPHDKGKK